VRDAGHHAATAGNRQLRVRVLDNANNPLLDVADANTVPASQTAAISYAGLQSLASRRLAR